MKNTKKKTKVRIWSFALAAVLVLAGFAVSGYASAAEYSTRLGITYERNLSELSEHIDNIETDLLKGRYAVTSSGASDLSMKLWSEALSAKTCLSGLPTSGTELDNTYKFLSQVGEFSLSLAKKISKGEQTSDQEQDELEQLLDYAKQINNEVAELCVTMNDDGKWADSIKNSIYKNDGQVSADLNEGFNNVEEHLSNFPTLLYDGPFSDHILQAKAVFLDGKSDVTADAAKSTAAALLGTQPENLSDGGEENGIIPSYNFYYNDSCISITKAGGYCSYILNSREISDSVYGYDECLEKAKDFLGRLSLGSFKESYFALNEGVCVINFAYTENDIIYYTDLVKVGVATDTGEIVTLNTQGYIMNHKERSFDAPKNDISSARQKLSPILSKKSEALAIIPLDTQNEKLCYEFLCEGQNGEEILVYINADTLEEEKILVVLKTDGGVLTK